MAHRSLWDSSVFGVNVGVCNYTHGSRNLGRPDEFDLVVAKGVYTAQLPHPHATLFAVQLCFRLDTHCGSSRQLDRATTGDVPTLVEIALLSFDGRWERDARLRPHLSNAYTA